MGVGAFAEPLVVISLLVGGTLINRERRDLSSTGSKPWGWAKRNESNSSLEGSSGLGTPTDEDGLISPRASSPGLLAQEQTHGWKRRSVGIFGWSTHVRSPDTKRFEDRLLSRVLRRLPFLVEVWYWALIYWVYQLGRAFTAVTLLQGTVDIARRHALQVIHMEQSLGLFVELPIQQYFLQFPTTMHWINRIYSFIHIPGTILFLIWLYYSTITSNRLSSADPPRSPRTDISGSPEGPALYQARRRTMAMCNLIAFVIFTAWPCMPPRLLSDPNYNGPENVEAKSYGFVDTVHGATGESSVWTQNKFCNQYAAMPSLHFGYSLLIGLTIITIPLAPQQRRSSAVRVGGISLRLPSTKRMMCVILGAAYPTIILTAIVATANHFVLDAVAGAIVCGIAWKANKFLLNFCPLEDWFLWCLRMHKPPVDTVDVLEGGDIDEKVAAKGVLPK
ncbi:hypothetical protein MBLNU230_g0129t1 [Neophaeotheca triangularis]